MNSENDMARGETIGRHLYNFAHMKNDPRAHDPAPDWEDAGSMTREMWRKLGRECLRQMEWARAECVKSVDSFGAGNSWLVNISLTVAPDDWSPPECST